MNVSPPKMSPVKIYTFYSAKWVTKECLFYAWKTTVWKVLLKVNLDIAKNHGEIYYKNRKIWYMFTSYIFNTLNHADNKVTESVLC